MELKLVFIKDSDSPHSQVFVQLLTSILHSDIAERTFARAIECSTAHGPAHDYEDYDSFVRDHPTPSQQSIEAFRAHRNTFRAESLSFEATVSSNSSNITRLPPLTSNKTIQAYQDTVLYTQNFNLRLLEMVAIACHNIAVFLFLDPDSGLSGQNVTPLPASNSSNGDRLASHQLPAHPYHGSYMNSDQYPRGIPDIVGYWAELELFGGVVLFDRGNSKTECKNAFIHPTKRYFIFELSEQQLLDFVSYKGNESDILSGQVSCPLPFKAERYARRVNPFDSMALHIYRDEYERKPEPERPGRTIHRGIRRLEDDPVMLDWLEKRKREGWD